jgi:hypothetical protein
MYVLDDLGLVRVNNFLVTFLPASEKAMVFRIRARANEGYERLAYGPLPLTSGTTLYTFEGGTATVPADGVMPARSYTPDSRLWTPPASIAASVYDSTDIWYIPTDWNERLFHIKLSLTPKTLRTQLEFPKGTKQVAFQRDKIVLTINSDFGFKYGELETVQFPGLHYGWYFANELNAPVYTYAEFTYAENIIEIPKEPQLIFDILTGKYPAHWITLPCRTYEEKIKTALEKTYGFDGYKIWSPARKEEALKDYAETARKVIV